MSSLPVLDNAGPGARPRPRPPYLATAARVDFGDGFYGEEVEDLEAFRWMRRRGRLRFAAAPTERFLEVWVLSQFHDLSQRLTVRAGERLDAYSLTHGWTRMSLPVPAEVDALDLETDRIFPRAYYPDDPRELAIRLRAPSLHADAERHAHVSRQYVNGVLNTREMLEGATELRSTPRMLGIDMYGACNVKPPCVYCEWDEHKALEGPNVDVPFTRETLEGYGDFFDNASKLVNCSIGEPFMMKNLDGLLDVFGDSGKLLEITTNGQILTDRNIERLLGRNIGLYISLDAATPETYARLRNDRLADILANLRRLVAAKGGTRGLPRIFLVFMPMRANVHELEDFVKLCAELRIDRMILRPLNYSETIDLDWRREGYHFRYQDEILPFDRLLRASVDAARWCREHGVELADQMDFGGSMRELFPAEFAAAEAGESGPAAPGGNGRGEPQAAAAPAAESVPEPAPPAAAPPSLGAERFPACQEPWFSLYILRRGVYPCCYGKEPLAPMEDHAGAWNSRLMRAIRRELAAGRFHRYCLTSTSCPMIRKSEAVHSLPWHQAARLRVHHLWHRANRRLFGLLEAVRRPIAWILTRAWRALADSAYRRHHARRLLGRLRGGS